MHGSFQGITFIAVSCWVVAAVLALSSLVLMANTKVSVGAKRLHLVIWLGYIGLAMALILEWLPVNLWGAIIATFGIPILVAAHFGYLLTVRQKIQREARRERV